MYGQSKPPLPSLNALRTFEVVARHLNFRLAAEELGVTQSAVAQQIRALEAGLQVKLFERGPRTLTLTESGRTYIASIRRAFELIAEATGTLRPEPQHLTISVTPTFASKWLIPRLPSFTEMHPDIDLRVLASERLSSFQADAVDLAVRYGRPPFGPGLDAELLMPHSVVAVASPRLFASPKSLTIDILRQAPLLHDAHNVWPQFLLQALPDAHAVSFRNIRFNQTGLAIEAAIAGQGIALASPHFVEADLAAGRLVRLSPVELRVGADFYIVSPRRPRPQAPVAKVRSWLQLQARQPVQLERMGQVGQAAKGKG